MAERIDLVLLMHSGHLCQVRGQLANFNGGVVITKHFKHFLTVHRCIFVVGTGWVRQILFFVLFDCLNNWSLRVDCISTETLDFVKTGDGSVIGQTFPVKCIVVILILLVCFGNFGVVERLRLELVFHVSGSQVAFVGLWTSWRRCRALKSFHFI